MDGLLSGPGTDQTDAQVEDDALLLESEFTAIVREEVGMHEAFASQVARALVRGLRKRMPAQQLYIPAPDKAERDAAIRREFNGRNTEELMRRYDVGRRRLYQIVGDGRGQPPGK